MPNLSKIKKPKKSLKSGAKPTKKTNLPTPFKTTKKTNLPLKTKQKIRTQEKQKILQNWKQIGISLGKIIASA